MHWYFKPVGIFRGWPCDYKMVHFWVSKLLLSTHIIFFSINSQQRNSFPQRQLTVESTELKMSKPGTDSGTFVTELKWVVTFYATTTMPNSEFHTRLWKWFKKNILCVCPLMLFFGGGEGVSYITPQECRHLHLVLLLQFYQHMWMTNNAKLGIVFKA